jgi:hypothetical protein
MHFSTITAIGFSSLAMAQIHDSKFIQARPGHLFARAAAPAVTGAAVAPGAPGAGAGGAGGAGAGGPGGQACYKETPQELQLLDSSPAYPDEIYQQLINSDAPPPADACGALPASGTLAAVATSVYAQILDWRDTNSAALLSMMSKVDAACPGEHAVDELQRFLACPKGGAAAAAPTAAPGGSGGSSSGGAAGGSPAGGAPAGGAPVGSPAGASAKPTSGGAAAGTGKPKSDAAASTSSATAATTSGPATKPATGAASARTAAVAAGGMIAAAIGAVLAL